MTLTFLEWAESLPESHEAILMEFLRATSKAVSVTDINVAAGLALQALKGVQG